MDDSGHLILTACAAQLAPRSRTHAQFDRLVREIAQLRERLQQWQQCEERYHRRIADELAPELKRWRERQRELALLLDGALLDPPPGRSLSRGARQQITELMLALTDAVLAETPDDAELRALLGRYRDDEPAPSASSSRRKKASAPAPEAAESPSADGLEAEAVSTDDLCDQWERAEAERRAQAEAKRDAARHDRRQQAARTRREQGGRAASPSVRDVYRKLASRLHPDREPDPAERERKTALMQRVNQAYEACDLLTLLNLQIEFEQIRADDLAAAPEPRLKHYNEVLADQRDQLQAELDAVVKRFGVLRPDLPARADVVTPQLVETMLGTEIRDLRARTTALDRDLKYCRDRRYFGDWLRSFG